MINRYLALCDSCTSSFTFRAVVPQAKSDGFAFCCPTCNRVMLGSLELDYGPPPVMKISPTGYKLLSPVFDDKLEVVTISTDLPVHKIFHKRPLNEGGSPFLWLLKNMESSFMKWKETVDGLQRFRELNIENIKQMTNYAGLENWKMIEKILRENYDEEFKEKKEIEIIFIFNRIMSSVFFPIIPFEEMVRTLDEYYFHLNHCLQNRNTEYKQLLSSFETQYNYAHFRKKIYSTFYRILNNFDSFVTGLLYEYMSNEMKAEIDYYRLFRNDYDTIKILYQDIFELNSKMMMYIGSIINLSKRGNPESFITGTTSMAKFQKLKAFDKLKVLDELPEVKRFIDKVSRLTRNEIGHFLADYDCLSGNLVFEDGTTQNYIEFLGRFLFAVRSIWLMLIVIEKAEIDFRRLGLK